MGQLNSSLKHNQNLLDSFNFFSYPTPMAWIVESHFYSEYGACSSHWNYSQKYLFISHTHEELKDPTRNKTGGNTLLLPNLQSLLQYGAYTWNPDPKFAWSICWFKNLTVDHKIQTCITE